MELIEFAEKYFKEKDIKPSKHQEEMIKKINTWKRIFLRIPRKYWIRTLEAMYNEYLKKNNLW